MYRVHFDFVDVVLANTTTLNTVATFTAIRNQQLINQGKNMRVSFRINVLSFISYLKNIFENDRHTLKNK